MTDILFGTGIIAVWLLIVSILLYKPCNKLVRQWLQNKKNLAATIGLISLAATLGSLWYSDVIGFEPCRLCWYQRIFMYPIALLGLVGFSNPDTLARPMIAFVKPLAWIGWVIAVFHVVEQRLPQTGLSCGSVGQAVSCDTLWVNAFGLVTIPTMALTMFSVILLVMYLSKQNQT